MKQEVSPDLPAAQVAELIGRLSEANLISYRHPAPVGERDTAADAYWDLAGLDADRATSALGALTVEIVALGSIDATLTADACRACGVAVGEPGNPAAAVSLVLCEDYLDPQLNAVNTRHLASGRPWLLAKPTGADPWVGPVFRPGGGPCWACLAKRLRGQRHCESARAARRGCARIRAPARSVAACWPRGGRPDRGSRSGEVAGGYPWRRTGRRLHPRHPHPAGPASRRGAPSAVPGVRRPRAGRRPGPQAGPHRLTRHRAVQRQRPPRASP